MILRIAAVAVAATALLSGCSTISGSEDLFGYATPQPGVLASTPALVEAAASQSSGVLPLPTAPAAAPRAENSLAPANRPSSADDLERDRMIAAALAPADSHQSLGELDRNHDGSMNLPEMRSVEIIDIAPIRNSMIAADDDLSGTN